jgi:hypothetical protein
VQYKNIFIMSKKIIAIGITPEKKAYKYRLQNTPRSISSFEKFARRLNIEYINYYDKDTRAFIRRANISSAQNIP